MASYEGMLKQLHNPRVTMGSLSVGGQEFNLLSVEGEYISIKGFRYHQDDSTAVNSMSEDNRNTFWLYCSDKGKDSDLYREFALRKLNDVLVLVKNIVEPEFELYVINHAHNLSVIGTACMRNGEHGWFYALMGAKKKRNMLVENAYAVETIVTSLRSLNYSLPFKSLVETGQETLSIMLKHPYETKDLLTALKNRGYLDPLRTLSNLKDATFPLFCQKQYEAIIIINAIKEEDPVAYLEQLGHDAMSTIFKKSYEYEKKIAQGTDLKKEFAPREPASSSNIMNQIRDMKNHMRALEQMQSLMAFAKEVSLNRNTDCLSSLNLNEDKLAKFQDASTGKIAEVPVRLNGILFDYNTLINLPTCKGDSNVLGGIRKNPLDGTGFSLLSLQPARDIQQAIDELMEAHKAAQYSAATSFSPGF